MANAFALRLPNCLSGAKAEFTPPDYQWLEGQWYVTHTSLPLWKDKRNVTINYKALPADKSGIVKIEDTDTYQALNADKVKTITGANTPTAGDTGAFDWRGYGWLKIATSHWEILGWGNVDADTQWLVTYFEKTLFTPAGIDVYSRQKGGLPDEAMVEIKNSMAKLEHPALKKLVEELYEITRN